MSSQVFCTYHLKKDNDAIVIKFGKQNGLFYMTYPGGEFHSKEEQRVKDRMTEVYSRFKSKGYEDIK